MMVLNEEPHGFISVMEVKNEGFIGSFLSERWVTHPTKHHVDWRIPRSETDGLGMGSELK